MIYIVATMHMKPDKKEECLKAARVAIAESRKEKGCHSYDLHISVTDPNTFVFVERWENRDCITAHMNMPHFKEWRKVANECIASRKVEIIEPAKVEVL